MAINKHGYTSNTCMNCGAPTEGQTRCKDCMTMTARANKARRERYRSEGRCTICGTPAPTPNCDRCRTREKNSKNSVRNECLAAYGGRCSCCGEEHVEFLLLSCVVVPGAVEQQSVGGDEVPKRMYARLKKDGYPSGFQVLCANCNLALGLYGHCPHHAAATDPGNTSDVETPVTTSVSSSNRMAPSSR